MLQTAFSLPDSREAGALTGHSPRPAGAAGRQEQRWCSSARHLRPVAFDKPYPGCSRLRLQEVTVSSRAWERQDGSDGDELHFFLLCRGMSLAVPQVGMSWIGPSCHLGQGQALSRKCHVSVKLWNVCVWSWPVLPTSEWVSLCAYSCVLMFMPSISEQIKLSPLYRGTLL